MILQPNCVPFSTIQLQSDSIDALRVTIPRIGKLHSHRQIVHCVTIQIWCDDFVRLDSRTEIHAMRASGVVQRVFTAGSFKPR